MELTESTFYIVNNLIDILLSVLMATFYTVLLSARETKFFIFILACVFLVLSVVTLVFYIIDDTYATLWHKRYFQIRTIMAAVLMVLFISALINLFFEGKEIWVLMTSFSFLFANLLLTFIVIWSTQMVQVIKKQRRKEMLARKSARDEDKDIKHVTQSAVEKRTQFDKRGSRTEHSFYPKDEK